MSKFSEKLTAVCERHPTLYRCIVLGENAFKKPVFGCQDCGQCILSHTAFICCMRCPKEIRNGPCGGTRDNGHCEVYPERYCVWWRIGKRAKRISRWKKLRHYHVPVNRRFHATSAWLNMFAGKIEPISLSKDKKED